MRKYKRFLVENQGQVRGTEAMSQGGPSLLSEVPFCISFFRNADGNTEFNDWKTGQCSPDLTQRESGRGAYSSVQFTDLTILHSQSRRHRHRLIPRLAG